jgi:hypothetical protein
MMEHEELLDATEAAASDPDVIDEEPMPENDGDAPASREEAEPEEQAAVLDELRRSEDGAMSFEELSEATGIEADELRGLLERLRLDGRVVEPDLDTFTLTDPARRDDTEALAASVSEPEPGEEESEEEPDPDEPSAPPAAARTTVAGEMPIRVMVVVEPTFPVPAGSSDADIAAFVGDVTRAMEEAAQALGCGTKSQVVKVEAFDTPRPVRI